MADTELSKITLYGELAFMVQEPQVVKGKDIKTK